MLPEGVTDIDTVGETDDESEPLGDELSEMVADIEAVAEGDAVCEGEPVELAEPDTGAPSRTGKAESSPADQGSPVELGGIHKTSPRRHHRSHRRQQPT